MKIQFTCTAILFFCTSILSAQQNPAPVSKQALPDWVERSNQNTRIALEAESKFNPEEAARQGVTGLDEQIRDVKPGVVERQRAAEADVVKELEQRLAKEKDPLVRQDLAVMAWVAPHLVGRIPIAALANPPALVELFAETITE